MNNYIDGFVFPIPRKHLEEYKNVAEQVAAVWKEYGATSYSEFVGDDMSLAGTRSFVAAVDAKEDEVVVFGLVVFPSKEIRDSANKQVATDPRMTELVSPLTNADRMIFDASKMVYGGFRSLVEL